MVQYEWVGVVEELSSHPESDHSELFKLSKEANDDSSIEGMRSDRRGFLSLFDRHVASLLLLCD